MLVLSNVTKKKGLPNVVMVLSCVGTIQCDQNIGNHQMWQ